MKKILLLVVLTCITTINALADIANGTCGDNLTWVLSDDGTLTISGTGEMTDYTNSSNVPWYSNRSSIKNVLIKEGVTSIGDNAFTYCSGLTSITIPNSVTSIGSSAFNGCTGLTSINIPNSVTSIEDWAFYGCTGLTSVTIPNSVTSIGSSAFDGCTGLTSVTIGNSVTSIGEQAFDGCSGLTSVTIPNSVTSIGSSAFDGCTGLTSVTIPNSVTSIGSYAFSGCTGLTSVYVSWSRPLSIDSRMFSSVDKNNCTLYVPKGTFSMYASAQCWMDFVKIVEYGEETDEGLITKSSLKEALKESLKLKSDGKYVYLMFDDEVLSKIEMSTIKEDANGDGKVDSQDALKVYDYMKNH